MYIANSTAAYKMPMCLKIELPSSSSSYPRRHASEFNTTFAPSRLAASPNTRTRPDRSRNNMVFAQKSGESRIMQSKRGRALVNGSPVIRAGEDDPLLHEIARELSPVEAVNLVQWYPGHIAKAERELKEQLRSVDVILEVRDGRCPMSTRHPQLPGWCGSKPRMLILNRRDMISDRDAEAWTKFFTERNRPVIWTNGNDGSGVAKVVQRAVGISIKLNEKRVSRGLRPRPVRAAVVGFPNVGKSALINRLLGRRMASSAPRPGVTRVLKWMRIGGELDLLDAPGIIPVSFKDQVAASRLAICNDIGEASYVSSLVAAAFLDACLRGPGGSSFQRRVEQRYQVAMEDLKPEEYVHALADIKYNYEPERAGQKILQDFRLLNFGKLCLDTPGDYVDLKEV